MCVCLVKKKGEVPNLFATIENTSASAAKLCLSQPSPSTQFNTYKVMHAHSWIHPYNYKHVPAVMTVCVMKDTNIGTVISQALKLAMTRSRMLFVPKQRERHLLALPRHSQSMSKVPPVLGTAVCGCWVWSENDEKQKRQEMHSQWKLTSCVKKLACSHLNSLINGLLWFFMTQKCSTDFFFWLQLFLKSR